MTACPSIRLLPFSPGVFYLVWLYYQRKVDDRLCQSILLMIASPTPTNDTPANTPDAQSIRKRSAQIGAALVVESAIILPRNIATEYEAGMTKAKPIAIGLGIYFRYLLELMRSRMLNTDPTAPAMSIA